MTDKNSIAAPKRYFSQGSKISKSSTHADMWIINNADGFHFHALSASSDLIKRMYPPDQLKKFKRVVPVNIKVDTSFDI